ncbi:UNVERIFIED_CONTAM: hypothetical protein Scaly_1227300 [Sesamum calycinum]|uniref:Uncharacterized protein n=1 Tax=Sesamum calycinum TaxID=2727403 RepID=A0AAW2Q4T9_9LAMI
MDPEYVVSGSEGAKPGLKCKQMGHEEKAAAVHEEIKRMHRLPPNSSYASHRLRVKQNSAPLSLQRTASQDEELELLFSGLHL